ncbi:hypothetical protein PIROE2DRAFT_16852 [Piromyces sp. E2]|nr:hypothetical protein PIROE2DRAFT_16852 [Piromyces sp. E2]|eukprot:OUM57990.1 hypothetical protein PIROE2DRAFT_16852 [Piromyces sp. E2]
MLEKRGLFNFTTVTNEEYNDYLSEDIVTNISSVKKSKINRKGNVKEPNNYLAKIYKKINWINAIIIIVPSLIALIAEIIVHANNYDFCP